MGLILPKRQAIRRLYIVEGGDQDYYYRRKDWAKQAAKGLRKQGYKNVRVKRVK